MFHVTVFGQTAGTDIVLYAAEAPVKSGAWRTVADSSAAGGSRISHPDAGAAKLASPLASPIHYFEMSFNADAGRAYRLWVRGKAENNYWGNDSVYVQFSGSLTSSGAAVYRIGTTSGTTVNIEDCSDFGLMNWGWQDNGWGSGVLGPLIYFQSTGSQTVRVQTREDGISIDQIVLSPLAYLSGSPGLLKNDTVILPKSAGGQPDVVLWAADVPSTGIRGNWIISTNSSAAGQTEIRNPDNGAPKLSSPLASPSHYFETTFNATSGVPYRLWVRGRAEGDNWANDSAYVQFSGSVDSNGAAVFRIGTTSATTVNLEDCSGCGLSGWGWQDNGWGVGVFGPLVYFQGTGQQTIRIQTREDGLAIDQIVLSPANFLSRSPGSLRSDTTILQRTGNQDLPPPNQVPQVSIAASPTSGTAPMTASFNSNASDPDGSVVTYSWVFGNGQTSTLEDPSAVYQSAGTYTARLTVTDNLGATASASLTITVTNPTSTGSQLKVLSWNIAMSRGTDNILNLDRTATWIANINPHVAALCEVTRFSGDDQVVRLATLMSQKTGATWYTHFVPKYPGCPEGNLILSRIPLSSVASRYMSYDRSIAQATINVNGRNISFFATHLDHTSSSLRAVQVAELTSWALNFAAPHIICGDFNGGPDTSEISGMVPSYFDSWVEAMNLSIASAYPDNPVQMHTRTRRGRIDYVFYSKFTSALVLRSAQVPDSRDLSNPNVVILLGNADDRGVRPSDHNHMVATFDVR